MYFWGWVFSSHSGPWTGDAGMETKGKKKARHELLLDLEKFLRKGAILFGCLEYF